MTAQSRFVGISVSSISNSMDVTDFFALHGSDLMTAFFLAVAVIGYMVFQDWRDGKFSKDRKVPIPVTDSPVMNRFLEELANSMKGLQAHFNDETTFLLTEIQQDTKPIPDMQKDIGEILDIARNTRATQIEAMKYGVPVRNRSPQEI